MSTATEEAKAKESRDAIFSAHQGVNSMCARYTYNMAYYFMNGKMQPQFTGSGNMGESSYYNGITNLGYTKVIDKQHLSKENVKIELSTSTFPPGSVVCYKGETAPSYGKDSHYVYGHTQFYVGGSRNKGTSFPSSQPDNYGQAFVYDERPCDQWEYKVFVPSGNSALYYCQQEYVPSIQSPTLASPPLNNLGKPGSGSDFYKPYNVSMTESARNANGKYIVQRLRNEAGLTLNEACAIAGCFGLESRWNPTAYSENQKAHDFGIAQWITTYGRQQYLFETICNSDKTKFRSLEYQTNFVIFELKNSYTSPTNGGTLNYSMLPSKLHELTQKGASLTELTWCAVCYYEAGLEWRNIPYSKVHWDNNDNHIKQRVEWAQKARNLF
jgi:hypothetical protein